MGSPRERFYNPSGLGLQLTSGQGPFDNLRGMDLPLGSGQVKLLKGTTGVKEYSQPHLTKNQAPANFNKRPTLGSGFVLRELVSGLGCNNGKTPRRSNEYGPTGCSITAGKKYKNKPLTIECCITRAQSDGISSPRAFSCPNLLINTMNLTSSPSDKADSFSGFNTMGN